MAHKIYTRVGDGGNTALIGGTKVPKNDLRIETYGTVDELNSWIGLVNDQLKDAEYKNLLKEIQDRLFTIGSSLATDSDKDVKMALPDLHATDVALLENQIDFMTEQLPEMKSFVLPGGHVAVSSIHIARCVCRRAERLAVGLRQLDVPVNELVIQYLNRLSDYLFTLARYAAHKLNVAEIAWKARI
jgi:cob(I)alamin adenosyltransferase